MLETTVGDLFQRAVRNFAERVAVKHGDRSLTYRQLGEQGAGEVVLTVEPGPEPAQLHRGAGQRARRRRGDGVLEVADPSAPENIAAGNAA